MTMGCAGTTERHVCVTVVWPLEHVDLVPSQISAPLQNLKGSMVQTTGGMYGGAVVQCFSSVRETRAAEQSLVSFTPLFFSRAIIGCGYSSLSLARFARGTYSTRRDRSQSTVCSTFAGHTCTRRSTQ